MKTAVIDTCCLINLYASQCLSEIVGVTIEQAIIPEATVKESLYIRKPSEDDPGKLDPAVVDLNSLINGGVLKVTELSGDAEQEMFVRLAGIIDDGEAECLAIASLRSFVLATDDRRAMRVAGDLNVEVVTTPELLQIWMKEASPNPEEVRRVIHNIERYGRFKPHSSSVHAKWWREYG